MRCKGILKSGANKGQQCSYQAKYDGLCGKHKKDSISARDDSNLKNASSINDVEECVVCLCDLDMTDLTFNQINENCCNHRIHKECIIKSGKLQCPLCRMDISSCFNEEEKSSCHKYKDKYNQDQEIENMEQIMNMIGQMLENENENEDEHDIDNSVILLTMNVGNYQIFYILEGHA